ncbi:MAG: trypsin-like peptidase domain-containing protein, partial [Rubritepida sp.]|nr:trypsin-like peptidase domain-containing protein [Rubritepida sp.]
LLRGGRRLPAAIAAADLASDRCLLQVAEPVLRAAPGQRAARDLRVGERVYAIGAPRGLELTLTEGLVSALRRMDGIDTVQSTAPTAPGSSGGGLFDARGNLVGITTSGVGRSESLNFALAAEAFWQLRPE